MRRVGLLALGLLIPLSAFAAGLININTADLATLETLPHIGPTLGQRIIDYRTQHGPFASIQDLQKVSGIGSGSNYADIAPLITVDAPSSSAPDTSSASGTSTEQNTQSSSDNGSPPQYAPISALRVVAGGDRTVSSGADTVFTAAVYDGKGTKRDDATVVWSFGDGMRRVGASVFHAYYHPGDYVAVARAATPDGGDAIAEFSVTVKNARVRIASVSSLGITIANDDTRTLDLSFWYLSMGGQQFKIPEDTKILSGRSTLFPSQIIELPAANSASLLYPNGEVAATYPSAQLPASGASYQEVQAVEPAVPKSVSGKAHDDTTVSAPAAANGLAAAGAALPAASTTSAPRTGIFRSSWMAALVTVITLAGGAFIFL